MNFIAQNVSSMCTLPYLHALHKTHAPHWHTHDHEEKEHRNESFVFKISDKHQIYELMHAHKKVHINVSHVNC